MSIPCICTLSDIDWEEDMELWEDGGSFYLQPGECGCEEERTYYKQWEMSGVQDEDGRLVKDFTSRY